MSKPLRIGVLGGAFDPVHEAHLRLARAALEEGHVDKVLFVVAARPPHKDPAAMASPEDRFAMTAAALRDEPRMEASRIEMERGAPSYTVDTLKELERRYPGARLYLILGMDSVEDLPNWRDPQGILERARLLVARRPGDWNLPEMVKGRYDALDCAETSLSSTEVRRRIAQGEPINGLVPAAVARLIRERGIYG